MIVFSFIFSLKSFASLPESEEKGPEIIRHDIKGASEFAKLMEEKYIPKFQGSMALISDVDGVVTDLSDPTWIRKKDQRELSDGQNGLQNNSQSRGDMVPYLKRLIARQILVIFSSAWPNPEETFARLISFKLLKKKEKTQQGKLKIRRVEKYPPVTAEELKEAEDDEEWLSYLKNRPSEETFEDSYSFFQKGNCISVEYDPKYYRSKALSLDVRNRENPSTPQVKTMIFIEDSSFNIDIFLRQLPLTTYYPTLERVIIFKFPEISGEARDEDKIDPKYLTM